MPTSATTAWRSFAFVPDWAQRPYFRGRGDGEHGKGRFQGRQYELDQLKQFFVEGSGGTILVSGHRGVGKTATVDRALVDALEAIDRENRPNPDKTDRTSRRESWLRERNLEKLDYEEIARLRPKQLIALKLDFGQIATLTPTRGGGSKSPSTERNKREASPQSSPDAGTEVDPRQVLIEIIKGLHRHLIVERQLTAADRKGMRQIARLKAKLRLARRFKPLGSLDQWCRVHWLAGLYWRPHRRFWLRLNDALNQAMIRAYHQTYREEVAQGISRELVQASTSKWTFDYKKLVTLLVFTSLVALGVWYGLDRVELFSEFKQLADTAAVVTAFLGLAGSATFSTTRTMKTSDAIKVVYSRDSSVPSLKRDVEEIISLLESHQSPIEYRLVVVLDELDKLEDVSMLDGVIKSFKNLFTLNRCTFVFITDKSYFDHITRQQQDAAKQRTYAPQHTFFTRKIFLTKPNFEDVGEYLDVVNQDLPAKLAESKKDEDWSRDWRQTVRYLTFSSRCHYFDLVSLLDELVQATPPPTLNLTHERLTRVDLKRDADFQQMVELVYLKYRYTGPLQGHANNRLLAELYCVFDPPVVAGTEQPMNDHRNGRTNGAATANLPELTTEEQQRHKYARDELLHLLALCRAIDPVGANGDAPLQWRHGVFREPRADDLELDEVSRQSIANLRAKLEGARQIEKMLEEV